MFSPAHGEIITLSPSLFFYYGKHLQQFLLGFLFGSATWCQNLPLPRSTEILTHNYHCQLFPLIVPHGHSKICSCGFLFYLLSSPICLATFLDSTPGWLVRIPYKPPLAWLAPFPTISFCIPPQGARSTQELGPLISASYSSQQMREQVSMES